MWEFDGPPFDDAVIVANEDGRLVHPADVAGRDELGPNVSHLASISDLEDQQLPVFARHGKIVQLRPSETHTHQRVLLEKPPNPMNHKKLLQVVYNDDVAATVRKQILLELVHLDLIHSFREVISRFLSEVGDVDAIEVAIAFYCLSISAQAKEDSGDGKPDHASDCAERGLDNFEGVFFPIEQVWVRQDEKGVFPATDEISVTESKAVHLLIVSLYYFETLQLSAPQFNQCIVPPCREHLFVSPTDAANLLLVNPLLIGHNFIFSDHCCAIGLVDHHCFISIAAHEPNLVGEGEFIQAILLNVCTLFLEHTQTEYPFESIDFYLGGLDEADRELIHFVESEVVWHDLLEKVECFGEIVVDELVKGGFDPPFYKFMLFRLFQIGLAIDGFNVLRERVPWELSLFLQRLLRLMQSQFFKAVHEKVCLRRQSLTTSRRCLWTSVNPDSHSLFSGPLFSIIKPFNVQILPLCAFIAFKYFWNHPDAVSTLLYYAKNRQFRSSGFKVRFTACRLPRGNAMQIVEGRRPDYLSALAEKHFAQVEDEELTEQDYKVRIMTETCPYEKEILVVMQTLESCDTSLTLPEAIAQIEQIENRRDLAKWNAFKKGVDI